MNHLLVAAAIVMHEGKVLLTRRRDDVPHPGYWEFPGGKVEAGEDPRDCVVRELREELSLEISVSRVFDVISHSYPERPVLIVAFLCRWVGGVPENLQVAEHRWVHPHELPGYEILPADRPLVEQLSAGGE